MNRICADVINDIIQAVPATEEKLIADLNFALGFAALRAPEQKEQWDKLFSVLNKYIEIPEKDWEFKVYEIFTGIISPFIKAYIEE